MTDATDLLVIGGGVIGLMISREAARAGLSVRLVERDQPGSASSGKAAGMLMPHVESDGPTPLQSLALASRGLYPELVRQLIEESGIDPRLREDGSLLLAPDDSTLGEFHRRASIYRAGGQRVELLHRDDLRRLEPALAGTLSGGLLLPDDASLDNVLLVRGLHRAAERSGVRVENNTRIRRILASGDRVTGAESATERYSAGTVVIAAGAWSGEVETPGGDALPTHPMRGQIACLRLSSPGFSRILAAGSLYLVRRDEGRVLVGSTMERVGFDTRTTAEAINTLVQQAISLVPALKEADLESSWAGLRPATEDGLPAIGPGGLQGLLYATGHLRHGILLAPITAQLIVRIAQREDPGVDLTPFDPRRLMRPGVNSDRAPARGAASSS